MAPTFSLTKLGQNNAKLKTTDYAEWNLNVSGVLLLFLYGMQQTPWQPSPLVPVRILLTFRFHADKLLVSNGKHWLFSSRPSKSTITAESIKMKMFNMARWALYCKSFFPLGPMMLHNYTSTRDLGTLWRASETVADADLCLPGFLFLLVCRT